MAVAVIPGAIVRGSSDGDQRWFAGGGLHDWKARSEQTGGAFHAFVDHLERGKMTPLHMHPGADDSMYVISGEVLYHVDGQQHVIGAGGFVSALRGTPHAFMVTSETATVFCFQTPGAGQSFYLDASDPAGDEAPPGGGFDLERLQQAAAENPEAVVFLGPPPFGDGS